MARISPRAARGRLGVALWLTAAMLVVAAVAAWIVGEVAARHEGERIDARLQGSVQSAQAEFDSRLAEAGARAERLAASAAVQRALADADRKALADLAAGNRDVAFFRRGRLIAGEADSPARRAATVVRPGGGALGRGPFRRRARPTPRPSRRPSPRRLARTRPRRRHHRRNRRLTLG
jgi:hypothetical protein